MSVLLRSTDSAYAIFISLPRHKGTLSSNSSIIQLCLSTDNHPPIPREIEVGRRCAQEDLTQQHTAWIPDLHSITTSRIYISLCITVNAIRQTWAGVRKYLLARPCPIGVDIESIDGGGPGFVEAV
jgi:hypothetical protein